MPNEFMIPVEQGDTPDLVLGPLQVRDPITNALSPIDLTQIGIHLWLTAKVAKSDADGAAVFQKVYVQGGGGNTISVNSPASAGKNYATARLAAVDTEDLAVPVDLYADVVLQEPDGRVTTIARGTIAVLDRVKD
jgi:hypothetical protein